MNTMNMVIVTIASNRKILDTQAFISDEQFQKVMIDANKKGCMTKMMSASEAKYHRDYNLEVPNI